MEKKEEESKTQRDEDARKDIGAEDLIEVEKEVVKKPEFVEIKPKEVKKEIEPTKKLEKEEKDDLEVIESKQIEKKPEYAKGDKRIFLSYSPSRPNDQHQK